MESVRGERYLVGKLVWYKEKIYEVAYDYKNGYLEIREQNSHIKIELAKKEDVVEVWRIIKVV